MKNFEKHSIEEILTIDRLSGHPAIVNGKLVKCEGLSCDVCDLSKRHEICHNCAQEFIFWLYSEADPEKEENKNDPVNHPSHYTDGKIEVIDYIEDKGLGFCLGNAVKYISRAGKKDPEKEIEDLRKAAWYINRRIEELLEKENGRK